MTPLSEEDQVRRLLAESRHTDPIPPDVAERLDGVLADLGADRPVQEPVADLAAARRRTRARTMLVAAAAVIVVGVGLGQLGGGSSDDSAGSDAAAGGAAADGSERATAQESRPRDRPRDYGYGGAFESHVGAARVQSDTFGERALRLRDRRAALADTDTALLATRCVREDPGAGEVVPIRYDGRAAVLVYRPPRGETQVVDLYVCGRDGVNRTITLPAP